jgi:hypothetical protein
MPKIARYNQTYYFIPDAGTYITPNGDPDEIIDVSHLSGDEILKIKNNPQDKKLHKKNNLTPNVQ